MLLHIRCPIYQGAWKLKVKRSSTPSLASRGADKRPQRSCITQNRADGIDIKRCPGTRLGFVHSHIINILDLEEFVRKMLFIKTLALGVGLTAATTFQAFSSSDCSTGGGSTITVGRYGTCIGVTGRRSGKCRGDNCRFVGNSKSSCSNDADTVKVRYSAGDGACITFNANLQSICVVGM